MYIKRALGCCIAMFLSAGAFGASSTDVADAVMKANATKVRSLANKTRVRIKTTAAMPEPHAPSLTSVWPAANWHERETWDLLGITFDGHPDPRRTSPSYPAPV